MKIIAIGGEPGAGKTTLMWNVLHKLDITEQKEIKFVPYMQKDNIYVLGKYEPGVVFAGTDRMSMAVQPHAIEFLKSLPRDSVVLFEGDRLFNNSFLEFCDDHADSLSIVYLQTTKEIREERYLQRGSSQDPVWLQGRESKVQNILTNLLFLYIIETFPHTNLGEQEAVANFICQEVENALDAFAEVGR